MALVTMCRLLIHLNFYSGYEWVYLFSSILLYGFPVITASSVEEIIPSPIDELDSFVLWDYTYAYTMLF